MRRLFAAWNRISLVQRIVIGLVAGVLLALAFPEPLEWIGLLGSFFVSALKAAAPILVLVLVVAAIASHESGRTTNMGHVLVLYGISTLLAGLTAVTASFLFPVKLSLVTSAEQLAAPSGIAEVLRTLLFNIVDNPVHALMNANYIGILAWAIAIGAALRYAAEPTKQMLANASDAVTQIVRWIIELAPFGILGLVYTSITESGLASLLDYGKLLLVLVGSMLFIALIVNPIIVYVNIRRNPYPLVLRTIRESAITAFFTRSSAANIPVNMRLCEKMGLNKDTYAVSIPLGATINMAGAAITISVLALAAAHTLGVEVDFGTAVILAIVSAVAAAGTSGVAGGSLMLIPLACSLFGISNDIAMQVVGVGFIIGVLQDSFETALNSSSDVVFTATAEYAKDRKTA